MSEAYVALDLETTGLNAKEDKIIEIGAVLVKEGEIVETFSSMVNPRRQIPDRVVDITGICQEDVEDAPYLEELLPQIYGFIGDNDLLGHRILFDYSFLKKAFVNAKYSFEKKGIDTLKLSRKFLTQLGSKRLGDVCAYYGIESRAHRALEDAKAAHLIYQKLRADYYNENTAVHFQATPLIYKVKKEAPASKLQKARLLNLVEAHKIELTIDIDSMSKNEVSRMTDKILAKYGRSNFS